MGTTSSNLPNDYLVYICPECAWGQAVPAAIAEIEQWDQNPDRSTRECPKCQGARMKAKDSLHRINKELIPAVRNSSKLIGPDDRSE